jgi:hypothetical protein
MFTTGQPLPQQPTPPIAQAFNRYAARPLGPGDCMRQAFTGRCKKCGATVKTIHIMMRLISGTFCESCCPACHPGG